MLAWRYGFEPGMLMPRQGDRSLDQIRRELGLDFNGGRPHPRHWMVGMEEYKTDRATQPALEALGLSVVPLQAMLAASLLAHPPAA